MQYDSHDWIVFHRVRFAAARDGNGRPLPGPVAAEVWRFCPASPVGPNGMRTNISDEWGGFGIYPSRAAAEEVFNNPEGHLCFLDDAVEAYHAILVPYAHRGAVNWRGTVKENETIRVVSTDPGGPLMVVTSAGYDNPGPADLPRIIKFSKGLDDIQAYYATLPDNIRQAVYNGASVDGHDGMTITLWRNDAAMMAAAYKPGNHRTEMNYQRTTGHFDRSSFSRARILDSKGSWDGSDPVLEMS